MSIEYIWFDKQSGIHFRMYRYKSDKNHKWLETNSTNYDYFMLRKSSNQIVFNWIIIHAHARLI